MQLTQALTLVPERKREDTEDGVEKGRLSMDSIIDFLTGPVRDIPVIEFDLPKILGFYSKKGKDDNEARDVMKGVREFLTDAWTEEGEESIIEELIDKVVSSATRRLGVFIAKVIWGTIWRITKWLVKKVVVGAVRLMLRWLVIPVLEAVAGFLMTPVGLALAVVGGALAGGYLIYKAFFDKSAPETPKTEDDDLAGSGGTTEAAPNMLRQSEGATSAPADKTTASAAPARTSEGSLTTAAAPMPAGSPVAASAPPSDTKKMIMQHEGVKLQPYKDSLGLWTVGVGHLIGDGKSLPDAWNRTFTREEVMALFDQDYEHHKKAAMNIPNFNRLGEKAQAAFIDLTFNMGVGWFKKWPKLLQAMRDFDINAVIANLRSSKWAHQVQPSRVADVLGLLATELSGTAAASETPKMVPGATVPAATKQNQVKDAAQNARPGTAMMPPQNEKTIIKTPSGQLVAANM